MSCVCVVDIDAKEVSQQGSAQNDPACSLAGERVEFALVYSLGHRVDATPCPRWLRAAEAAGNESRPAEQLQRRAQRQSSVEATTEKPRPPRRAYRKAREGKEAPTQELLRTLARSIASGASAAAITPIAGTPACPSSTAAHANTAAAAHGRRAHGRRTRREARARVASWSEHTSGTARKARACAHLPSSLTTALSARHSYQRPRDAALAAGASGSS